MNGYLVSILAQIAAEQARVAGMQAENTQRQNRGESAAYTERDFAIVASVLDGLAASARSWQ